MEVTFNDVPRVLAELVAKVDELTKIISGGDITPETNKTNNNAWLNISELVDYLPYKTCKNTIYYWSAIRQIPSHKRGKRLFFLKSEIDKWLHDAKRKTEQEITEEATSYINSKKLQIR
jgi:predicted DNA-binding transcriptional regulator AlpA